MDRKHKKIIIIPHHPSHPGVKIRLVEIARHMRHDADVYLVNWHAAQGAYTLVNRVWACLRDFFVFPRMRKEDGLTIVEFPVMHWPRGLARRSNAAWLSAMIAGIHPDAVINGSYYLFPVGRQRAFRYIVDMADLPPVENDLAQWTKEQALRADTVVAVSKSLADYVQKKYGCSVRAIGNGFSPEAFAAVTSESVARVRKQWELRDSFVVGYAGYLGSWIDVDIAIRAVQKLRAVMPNAVAVFVGGGPDIDGLRRAYAGAPVVFTGPVSDIEPYIAMMDIGILPSKRSMFQDMAFHLKLIEYTAANKPVVSTPLEEAVRLKFNNIIFAQETVEAWTDALTQAASMSVQEQWMQAAQEYDWKNIVRDFLQVIP